MTGRHRAPSKAGARIAKAASLTLMGTVGSTLLPGIANAVESASQDSILAAIASCESGGKNIPTAMVDSKGRKSSTAGGYFQIVNGTWKAHGGLKFAPTALQASYAEQVIIAKNILNGGQGLGAWSESRSCWSRRIGKVLAPTSVKEAPKTVQKAAPVQKIKKTAPTPTKTIAKKAAASYVIKRGDTLVKIAARNGTTWRSLYNLNRATVRNPNLIFTGNTLRLR